MARVQPTAVSSLLSRTQRTRASNRTRVSPADNNQSKAARKVLQANNLVSRGNNLVSSGSSSSRADQGPGPDHKAEPDNLDRANRDSPASKSNSAGQDLDQDLDLDLDLDQDLDPDLDQDLDPDLDPD